MEEVDEIPVKRPAAGAFHWNFVHELGKNGAKKRGGSLGIVENIH